MGEYDETLGTLLIGVMVNTFLYGIACSQYATYHSTVFKDPLRIKAAVLILFVLDTFQSLLMIYLCWLYMVDGYGNSFMLSAAPAWPCSFAPIGTAVTASVTHLFLGHRIFNMSKNKIAFWFVISMTLAEFVTGVTFGIRMWTSSADAIAFKSLKPYVIMWLSIETTLDIFVSGFMSVFLHLHRTGCARTDSVINRLIRGCIRTGAFSAMLSISGLVAFVVRPYSSFWIMFVVPVGRTYTTTLMDTLNIRGELKERLTEGIDPNEAITWPRNETGSSAEAGGIRLPFANDSHPLSEMTTPKETGVPFPMFAKRDSLYDVTSRRRSTGEFIRPTRFPSPCQKESVHSIEPRPT